MNSEITVPAQISHIERPTRLQKLLASMASALPPDTAFDVDIAGERQRIGNGQVRFQLGVHNERGKAALASLDEKRIGEAYLDGDISLEGDLVSALNLRTRL